MPFNIMSLYAKLATCCFRLDEPLGFIIIFNPAKEAKCFFEACSISIKA